MSEFTILGLLGPAGSGKDLVADWFVTKGFVKVAFADPMKRFTLRAFGIEQERLWGPSEKRNEIFDVSDAWWYEVIGHFGDAAQEIVQNVLMDGVRVDGYLKLHDWLTALRKTYREKISARVILQTLGTEWGRTVDPMMWTRYAHIVTSKLSQGGLIRYRQDRGLYEVVEGRERKAAGVIIPDHRFRNEVDFTQLSGGYAIRLRRVSMEATPEVGVAGHQSESEQRALSDDLFDLTLGIDEFVIEEISEDGTVKGKGPDIESFRQALEFTFKEEAWKRGKGTKILVTRSS